MRRHLRDQQVAAAARRRDQRSQRARRAARVPGSRPHRRVRHHGPERVARRPRRAARAGHAPDRIGGVFSRKSTAPRSSPSRSTSCTAGRAAGRVRQTSAGHAGERQPHLSERRVDACSRSSGPSSHEACTTESSAQKRLRQPAVDRDHVSGRLRARVAGQPADRVRAICGRIGRRVIVRCA